MVKLNKRSAVILIIAAVFAQTVSGQVKFREISTRQEMEEAIALSDSLDKPIFIDVYATWCGPCKMMDRETFSDRSVGKLLNYEYIPLKMDGETDYGTMFAYQYQLEGYPSAFIFAPGGELISRLVGFMSAEELTGRLQIINTSYQNYNRLNEQYLSETLKPELYPEYLDALTGLGKEEEAEATALKYMEGIDAGRALTVPDIRIISAYVTPGTAIWDRMLGQLDLVKEVLDSSYQDFIGSAFYRSVLTGIQAMDIKTVDLFTAKLPELTEGTAIDGAMLTNLAYIQYFYYTQQIDTLFRYVDDQFAGPRKDNDTWLFQVASQLLDLDQQYADPEILKKSQGWFKTCLGYQEKFEYYFYLGMCTYMLGDTEQSMELFTKARKMAGDDSEKELIENVFNAIANE